VWVWRGCGRGLADDGGGRDRRAQSDPHDRPESRVEQLRRRRLGLGLLLEQRRISRVVASFIGENKEFARQYLG
jgi:hypothetical protein